MSGVFLAIEGGDGAGKGSVVATLSSSLHARGLDVLTTREPGGTPEGQALRQLLLSSQSSWEPWAELLLMTAARIQHVERVIKPALAAGRVVLSDRFLPSTIAYQGAGRGLPVDAILALHRDALADVRPDLTIILDIDPRIGLRRSRARLSATDLDEGLFEALDIAFHERVRASFLSQAAARPDTHAVVDASRSAEDVAASVVALVSDVLHTRGIAVTRYDGQVRAADSG